VVHRLLGVSVGSPILSGQSRPMPRTSTRISKRIIFGCQGDARRDQVSLSRRWILAHGGNQSGEKTRKTTILKTTATRNA
jgi:hypothetical protein